MSGEPTVIKYNNFDIGKVTVSDKPREAKIGGVKIVYINYGDKNNRVLIQTPLMNLPFGISRSDPLNKYSKPGDPKKYFIEPTFNKDDSKQAAFLESMQNFDRKIINTILEDGMTYISDPAPTMKDVLSKMGTGGFTVRYPLKKEHYETVLLEYPPSDDMIKETYNDPKIRLKIMKNYKQSDDNDREYDVEIYDSRGQEITMGDVPQRCDVRCLIECMGIRLINKNVFVSWKLRQMIVYGGAAAPLRSRAFIPSDDDDSVIQQISDSNHDAGGSEAADGNDENQDPDSEQEIDDNEELQHTIDQLNISEGDENEPEPEKPKRKGRARKKTTTK